MAVEAYVPDHRFTMANRRLIAHVNAVIAEYIEAGYRLTVRQLYYQLVARAIVLNTERSYKHVISVVNDGRMAGMIDWDVIEDRTRAFERRARFTSGKDVLRIAHDQFHMDMWNTQRVRPFVVIEKEALVGVLIRICNEYDVPLLAARGYPSATVLREFAQRDILPNMGDQRILIIHLGDHDPSGIDMSRDLMERLAIFSYDEVDVKRIALTMPQIRKLNPPPNPAKITDSRFAAYQRDYGDESWELDALPPQFLNELVKKELDAIIDTIPWEERKEEVELIRAKLGRIAKRFRAP